MFQSTFPRGERPILNTSILTAAGFNPRSHEGNDRVLRVPPRIQDGFNPRSHEGNDSRRQQLRQRQTLFQSTFPRGERHSF